MTEINLVSVCIVAYNEKDYLNGILDDIKSQTYPHEKIELLLIDSMSTDNTKKIMQDFAERNTDFHSIRVFDNLGRIAATGCNVAIEEFKGDALVRIDAHASIPEDFIEKNVEVLESGEYISGGPRPNIIKNSSDWGDTLLMAEQSMFGSSFAPYRNSDKKIYVDSIFHGVYRREVYEKVGLYNVNLARTEDNEMSYRIRQAGFNICYTPSVRSYQYARPSLKAMLKQKYGNGFWVMLTLKSCPKCLSLFHFVPFCFVLGILFTTGLSILGYPFLSALMWGIYWLAAIAMAVLSVRGKKLKLHYILLPFLFFLLHTSYGWGSFAALFKIPFWKDDNRYIPVRK